MLLSVTFSAFWRTVKICYLMNNDGYIYIMIDPYKLPFFPFVAVIHRFEYIWQAIKWRPLPFEESLLTFCSWLWFASSMCIQGFIYCLYTGIQSKSECEVYCCVTCAVGKVHLSLPVGHHRLAVAAGGSANVENTGY